MERRQLLRMLIEKFEYQQIPALADLSDQRMPAGLQMEHDEGRRRGDRAKGRLECLRVLQRRRRDCPTASNLFADPARRAGPRVRESVERKQVEHLILLNGKFFVAKLTKSKKGKS